MNEETTLGSVSPSQWVNIWHYLLVVIMAAGAVVAGMFFPPAFAALLIPLGWGLWRYLVIRCRRYKLSSQRIRITEGVLNQHIDEIELYRVKDIQMTRPFWMRIVGLSSVQLMTSDRSLPRLEIPAIRNGVEIRETLRKQVELVRDRKRVREMDFDGPGGDDFGDDIEFES